MAIATLGVTVLDCPDPRALAEFYAKVLGGTVQVDSEDWVEVIGERGRVLAFQLAPGHVPPRWPSDDGSQQFHLDFNVPTARLDEAEREVLALGAKLVEGDEGGTRNWRVYLDPAGHPFCLCAH
ncbi:VOC family protein [Streptomyces palmae]|uniref:VOC family protein n=1 Tax=Streptomyces palmae TaxID=1701085 RepID=A0A4Z0GRX0_9ACTN|nr:VOC family protein [Streptomyces palmae]TGA99328.1 VOC family protein [Streptomyces palmae]